MHRLLTVMASLPLALGATACSGSSSSATSAGHTDKSVFNQHGLVMARDADKDSDNPTRAYYDADDTPILGYGRAASDSEQTLIADLVRHYYRAAARDDGATICTLLFVPIAESLAQGHATTRSCAAAVARLVQPHRHEISTEGRKLRVLVTREEGDRGWVLLSFGPDRPPGRMLLEREALSWKIVQPLRSEMP